MCALRFTFTIFIFTNDGTLEGPFFFIWAVILMHFALIGLRHILRLRNRAFGKRAVCVPRRVRPCLKKMPPPLDEMCMPIRARLHSLD